jgi:hypothetical protein
MKLKLILATVIFAPTIVMAIAIDPGPVFPPREVLKESVITRPGEGGSGVYKPVEQANAIDIKHCEGCPNKPKGIAPPVAITDVTTKGGSGDARNNGRIADSAK